MEVRVSGADCQNSVSASPSLSPLLKRERNSLALLVSVDLETQGLPTHQEFSRMICHQR